MLSSALLHLSPCSPWACHDPRTCQNVSVRLCRYYKAEHGTSRTSRTQPVSKFVCAVNALGKDHLADRRRAPAPGCPQARPVCPHPSRTTAATPTPGTTAHYPLRVPHCPLRVLHCLGPLLVPHYRTACAAPTVWYWLTTGIYPSAHILRLGLLCLCPDCAHWQMNSGERPIRSHLDQLRSDIMQTRFTGPASSTAPQVLLPLPCCCCCWL